MDPNQTVSDAIKSVTVDDVYNFIKEMLTAVGFVVGAVIVVAVFVLACYVIYMSITDTGKK